MVTFRFENLNILLSNKLVILFLFFSLGLFGQELPPVVNYGPNQYSAGNQNWMITQSQGNLYFANSTGLLEYNGENWNLYPVPNNTIVRSVKAVNDRIYTGAYMEAGYWQHNEFGDLEYTSIVKEFPEGIADGEQFWQIEFLDGLVVFRSFSGIYFYDPKKDQVSKMINLAGKPISGLFQMEGKLFFQQVGEGLFTIENGAPKLVIPYDKLEDRAVMHLYMKNGNFSFVTGNSEFFTWEGSVLSQVNKQLSDQIGRPNILAALSLSDGSMMLGTVGSGILQIGPDGDLLNNYNQGNVLLNNTALNLFEDSTGNIWAGLDYGISMIDPNSAYKSFQDNMGEIGSVYASFEKNGDLYLGTNQGLYLRQKNQPGFELIEETKGQVWFIDEVEGSIICGHNSGTFLIEGAEAEKISDRLGTWIVKPYAENVFIQGHYNGISFLRLENSDFISLPMLENFTHSSKFIEIDDDQNVWVSNEHKGVFKMKIPDSLKGSPRVLKNYKFEEESGITSSLFRYNDTLYYSSKDNIYLYNNTTDDFDPENSLNDITKNIDRISGKMLTLESDRKLWGFSQEGIFFIQPAQLSKDYNLEFIYLDQDFRNIAIGYENITSVDEMEYLLGVANGYIRFDLPVDKNPVAYINLNRVSINALDSLPRAVKLKHAGEFDYTHNNISFNYSVPVHEKYLDVLYSYRLIGFSPNWSRWQKSNETSFKNLRFGDYTFEVKAKIGDNVTEKVQYDFTVQRPYYLSNIALLLYSLGLILIIFIVHFLYRRHHRKLAAENERSLKMKNLEAEQEIIKLKNERLEQDMANKNRELAVSTMSLIKKNEFLTTIKEQLKNAPETSKVKTVIKTIDKDISEEDNWKFFKKAFSNADKDFFKKIKSKHPDLTSNDLKLCAYLRLNLSSKEIAPLLNISVKSVEIKRYRLRKKMDLDRNTNLTEYILAL